MKRRRDMLGWMGLVAASVGAAPPGLPDTTLAASQAKLIREPFGELRIYFDGPTDQLSAMTAGSLLLKPGMSPHPPHRHPEEEFLLVTEGAGDISIGDSVVKAGPGAMMFCAADRLHGIVNTGTAPLLFYFYKWKK